MHTEDLLADEARYCSFGDTVHYVEPPKLFERCEGSYLFDGRGVPYLDLQMWYSAVNFGYANPRLNAALTRQLASLPQLASQYLHPTKIALARTIAEDAFRKWDQHGRVHFNVGGSQSIEDSLKLVRNARGGKSLMFAFEGGYHGRTLGASAITSSYRYRRRYGHFGERAHFVPFPYHFRGPKGMDKEEYGEHCVRAFARLFETEYNGVWDPKAGECEYAAFYVEAVQGTGGYVIPPKTFFRGLKKVLDEHGILLVVDEIQMGFFRTGKLWAIEHFDVTPDIVVFGKALTNGLNPLAGLWAREALISPTVFPPGSTHSTFASNPLGTAVGLETMKMLQEADYESMVMKKGAHFLAGLRDVQRHHPEIGDVDGLGLALRAEICEADGITPSKRLVDRMVEIGLAGELDGPDGKIGLVLDIGGYYKNVVTFAPSLHIASDEIDLGIALFDQVLTRAKSDLGARTGRVA
ncbi:MAG TPA: aminotransferase class III-fold pyridoxal phosphate-dependent enzyme [Caldimonas sp.]|jgi:4-aminobutyrate aminotransferase-like enzyme|nr:aminotransferase class III-fold pyridoxal phosphate-dependent enzyme [Caldimonas sp.]HEX4233700.1 aminotransferase class III-fold pyridoxal phosphate-dependent enzyme [Caldimonas sp.]